MLGRVTFSISDGDLGRRRCYLFFSFPDKDFRIIVEETGKSDIILSIPDFIKTASEPEAEEFFSFISLFLKS